MEAALADEEARRGEHRHAAVHDLSLLQALDLVHRLVGGEARGVEEAEGRGDARHALDVVLHLGRRQHHGVDDVDDAVVARDVSLDHLGAVHLHAVGQVERQLAALERRRLHAVGQGGGHHLAGHDVELEHGRQRRQVQQLRLGQLQRAQRLDEGWRRGSVSNRVRGRAARRAAAARGARTVVGGGEDGEGARAGQRARQVGLLEDKTEGCKASGRRLGAY